MYSDGCFGEKCNENISRGMDAVYQTLMCLYGVTIGVLNFEETAYFCRLPKIYTGTMLQMYNTML